MTALRLTQGYSSCGFAVSPCAAESHRWRLGIPDVELMFRHGFGASGRFKTLSEFNSSASKFRSWLEVFQLPTFQLLPPRLPVAGKVVECN